MARNFFTLFLVVLMFGLLYCVMVEGAKKGPKRNKGPRCSQLLTKVLVQKDFNIDRFTGTWYTITRTTELFGDNTYESPSMEIKKTADGKYTYSLTGKRADDTCIPVETGSLEMTAREGLMQMKTPGNPYNYVTMVVSFTGYKDLAIVYYCFKYKPGRKDQCSPDGVHVEILSRTTKPNRKLVTNYIQRTTKRLCVQPKRLKATMPGSCKIPDILEAAKKVDIDIQKPEQGNKQDMCSVGSIPVQPEFQLTMMNGLWYELSRTRFTFNKLESVVTRHSYDPVNNLINSIYTGATYFPDNDTSSACNPAILGMSRTKDGAVLVGDMEGRIGGEESGYFWVPMKILYADADYLMFYACYYVGPDGHCMPDMTEVSLLGRTPAIPIETRNIIYSLLPDICIDPKDMVDTLFKTNCSDWVKQVNELELSDCNLLDIPLFSDYDNSMLDGIWYLYKSISYSNLTLTGMVMAKKTSGREDPIQTRIYAFDPDNSSLCAQYDTIARLTCLDTGDHIVTPTTGLTGNFYFSKILNVSNDMLVEYTCTMRNPDNSCDRAGVQFNVFTKDKRFLAFGDDYDYDDKNDGEGDNAADSKSEENDANDDEKHPENDEMEEAILKEFEAYKEQFDDVINELARTVCLDPKDFQIETDWCYEDVQNITEEFTASDCDIDNHFLMGDVDDFVQEDIHGYWYEIVRNKDITHLSIEGPLVAYMSSESNETLQIVYTFKQGEGYDAPCSDVYSTILLPRCFDDSNGDYMTRFRETETQVVYAPFKVLYLDESKNIMLTYVCESVATNGTCEPSASFIRVWARTLNLSRDEIDDVFAYADWVCVDVSDESLYVEYNHDEDSSCLQSLEHFVIENFKTDTTASPDVGVEDHDQQQDQFQDIFALDDIERELLKPDDEFYYQ